MSPPVAGSAIDVAGDGTDGNLDGVGSAARFKSLGYVAAAHTAPVWIVGGWTSESIRLAIFTSDVPLRLNVTTLIATPGKQPNGVVMTNDDSILYTAVLNLQQIQTVLNPPIRKPFLGPSFVGRGRWNAQDQPPPWLRELAASRRSR